MIVQFAARTKAGSTTPAPVHKYWCWRPERDPAMLANSSYTNGCSSLMIRRRRIFLLNISKLSSRFKRYVKGLKPAIRQQTPVYHEVTFFLASNGPQTIIDF